MGSLSKVLSRLDRWTPVSDRFFGIEWLFIFALVDILLGFSISAAVFSLFVPLNYAHTLSVILDLVIIAAFFKNIFKEFDFAQLYKKWIQTSVRDPGDIAKLNETVSAYGLDQSTMESRKLFRSANESGSFLLNESKNTSSLRQRTLNSTDTERYSFLDRSMQVDDEKVRVLPASVLLSPKSPFTSQLYTEGHYNSVSFNNSKASTFDDESMIGKNLNWIFNSANFSPNDQSTGSYQVGFVMKDKQDGGDQKMRSESDEPFDSCVHTKLTADDGAESIFAKKSSSSLRTAVSTKREAFMKKLLDWNEDKMMDDSMRQKSVQALMEDLFACATIHRLTFNNAILSDLAFFSANLRSFLSNEVVKPLLKEIEETNNMLAQMKATFSVGTSPVDVLQMAMAQKPELKGTKLPYLIPFLSIHANQFLLVNKMKEFVQKPFVLHETMSSKSKASRLGFGNFKSEPEFLDETEFIFQILATYLDHRLAANSFGGDVRKPFTSVYVLKEFERPSFNQLSSNSFFIYKRNKKMPAFDFVINGGLDFYVTPATETESLFSAFMLLLIYCKQFNNGLLGDIRIDSKGLDLLRLFRSR